MRRRDFVVLVGATWTWPTVVFGQKQSIPVIGYLSGGSPGPFAALVAAFRQGLKQIGYVEGENVAIEYRWAEGHYERLPTLAKDLVDRKVDLITASGGDLAARAAKNATPMIPIVANFGEDPVATGLIASLARPGGNLTGTVLMVVELHAKRLELISELVPQAKTIGLLVNPGSPQTERVSHAMQEASRARGLQLHIMSASAESGIDTAFRSFVQQHVGALVVQADPFFITRREQLASLAARHSIPAVYEDRQFASAGGLLSYGTSFPEVYTQIGVYAGKILKGEKPADLPVIQPTKFELVVNLKSARALDLTIPQAILLRADEVIE